MSRSRAGVAGEAGSLHRRGVAAYLAAFGLLGRGLPAAGHSEGGPFPVRLEFETDQPTDDLTCHLSDGSAIHISAKRTCGNDRHLRDTVEQWAAQVPQMGDDDLLALAVAEPTGVVKSLGQALLKRHAGSPALLADEQLALEALDNLLRRKSADVQSRIFGSARILYINSVQAGDRDFDLAAAMLEGTVVGVLDGPRAVRALSLSMHTQAGKAWASGIADWVHVLRDDDVTVFADRRGPAGAAEMERQAALEEYRAMLGSQRGYLDLSLLADDLPPIHVDGLARDLSVSIDEGDRTGSPLLAVARRWPRLLLVGLPGAGKSVALRQLAATWAEDSLAPVPVLVPLRSIATRCPRSGMLTLSMLCEVAAQSAPASLRDSLAAALELSCREGGAVLLLDGLDECMDRRALVADGLSEVLRVVAPATGVVLATRSSGERAAGRLGLPTAQLDRPSGLDTALIQLLDHIASVRIPEGERAAWLAARSRWVEQSRDRYTGMSSVPLLATLLVLVAAASPDERLPRSRASLLLTAIKDSVRRWERPRPDPALRTDWPSDDQLLDGYAAIGHRLAETGEISTAEAEEAVTGMLASRWGLSPGHAAETAGQIMWFWDDHVGVFVRSDAGTVAPRSRVFAEIASAMWITKLPEQRIKEWVAETLRDPDRRESLQLAAELEPKVITELLGERGSSATQEPALVAAAAVRNGAVLMPGQLAGLVNSLADGAKEGNNTAAQRDQRKAGASKSWPGRDILGDSWTCACELAQLQLPPELAEGRRALLTGLQLAPELRTLAGALCALADSRALGRLPDEDEERAIRAALNLPIPRRERARRSADGVLMFRSGPSLAAGHVEVAIGAAQQLKTLDAGLAQRIEAIADRSSFLVFPQVARALADRGYRVRVPRWKSEIRKAMAVWTAGPVLPLLEAITRQSGSRADPWSEVDWRLPDLCALFEALGAPRVDASALLSVAHDSDEIRDAWMHCSILAAGLDVGLVAAQARMAIRERAQAADPGMHILALLITRGPGDPPDLEPARLNSDQHGTLIRLLGARSDWIADSSWQMLHGIRGDQLRDLLLAVMPTIAPRRRRKVAITACAASNRGLDTAAELLGQPDPAARAGAARFLSLVRNPGVRARELLADISNDDDLTIRVESRQPPVGPPTPTAWSCWLCADFNDLAHTRCQHCGKSERPAVD
jgi:hypothetical protein